MSLIPSLMVDSLSALGGKLSIGGGAPILPDGPVTPLLFITGAAVAFSPELTVVANFIAGDVVEVNYKPHAGTWGADVVTTTHTITTNELGGTQWNYVIPSDLVPGDYDWRVRFRRTDGSYGTYSNEVITTQPFPIPDVSYRGNGSHTSGTGTFNTTIDIGPASADRLVIVGLVSAGVENGSTSFFQGPIIVNSTPLTRIYHEETDRHKSWWSAVVPTGDGVVSMSIASIGNTAQPKIHFVWTLKNYNSATHKAVDGKGSNTAAVISVDVGDAVLGLAYVNSATVSINNLSSEKFTVHREDNGSSFTSFGALSVSGELIASVTNASFQLRLENPSSPGNVQSGGKTVIAFR